MIKWSVNYFNRLYLWDLKIIVDSKIGATEKIKKNCAKKNSKLRVSWKKYFI
jgi:hypothetical protein